MFEPFIFIVDMVLPLKKKSQKTFFSWFPNFFHWGTLALCQILEITKSPKSRKIKTKYCE